MTEPLSPTCAGCPNPRGTCFPGPCQMHLAREANRKARDTREADARRTPPLVGDECPCASCQREMQHIMGCLRDPANKGRAFHG